MLDFTLAATSAIAIQRKTLDQDLCQGHWSRSRSPGTCSNKMPRTNAMQGLRLTAVTAAEKLLTDGRTNELMDEQKFELLYHRSMLAHWIGGNQKH